MINTEVTVQIYNSKQRGRESLGDWEKKEKEKWMASQERGGREEVRKSGPGLHGERVCDARW